MQCVEVTVVFGQEGLYSEQQGPKYSFTCNPLPDASVHM